MPATPGAYDDDARRRAGARDGRRFRLEMAEKWDLAGITAQREARWAPLEARVRVRLEEQRRAG